MTAVLDVARLRVDIRTPRGTVHAVRGIDLTVGRGETLCVVGESGSGKSITALALMGLLPPTAERRADRFDFAGTDLGEMPETRMRALRGNRIAMIFQEPMTALNPVYSIGEQLVEGLLTHVPDTGRAAAEARAVDLLETCGIRDAAQRMTSHPHQLSGGQRQRVMIAMALMTHPDLLIADEPTTALDVTTQAQILDLLDRLKRDLRLGIVLITHDFDVVRRAADRVAVMYAGQVVESGTAADVLARPAHPYTRGLLACVPGTRAEGSRRLGHLPGVAPSLVGDLTGCQFRDRCAQARPACTADPPRVEAGPGHAYLCILPPDALEAAAHAAPAAPTRRAGRDVPAIEICGLRKQYRRPGPWGGAGVTALAGVDLTVAAGETLGVVGESGSGKSTLARAVLGLEAPSGGTVLLDGLPALTLGRRERARLIQPVFQDPYSTLNPRRTILAAIRMPLDVHGIGTPAERTAEARRLMDLCGLPARVAVSYPRQLSGGQRQRVAIAAALALKPRIVVLDEPTSALDVSIQAQILNLLQDLKAELGLTYLLISHDLHVVRHLSDRIAVMLAGSVVETGPTADLIAAARHDYTRRLLAARFAASSTEG
jgi:peptide/nickel transport system ATP-binding protein